jgi:hypothetical protein
METASKHVYKKLKTIQPCRDINEYMVHNFSDAKQN